jgi:hypothetical protein
MARTRVFLVSLAVFALAFAIGAGVATAATKTATLVPPAGWPDIRSACFSYSPCATGSGASCVARVQAVISACARDAAIGAEDCATASVNVDPANANVTALGTTLINAWKAAKPGY